mgnify:CR=1 FL=1
MDFPKSKCWNQDVKFWYMVNVTSTKSMFKGCTNYETYGPTTWNVTNVVNTSNMFENASKFNKDISSWKLSSLTNAERMFKNATDFSINLSTWGNLDGVNFTDFSLGSNATIGTGPAVWQTTISSDAKPEQEQTNIFDEQNQVAAVSEGVPFMSGPRYGFISIDDHQTNTRSEFQVVYGDSVRDDKIMARINLAPRSIHTLSLRDARMASLANKTRTYSGPVDIKKLTIKLYDEYGRIIDLNNTDWSFTLEFEKEIKRLVAPAYDSNDA